MSFYMAEYLGTTPDDSFYLESKQKYIETIDLAKDQYCNNYYVAIKLSALLDYDVLKKASAFQLKVEDFFNENNSGEDPKLGKFMTKNDFFAKFGKHFNVDFDQNSLEELWTLIKKYGDKEKLYFFEFRINFCFHNVWNEALQKWKPFEQVFRFTDKEKAQFQ